MKVLGKCFDIFPSNMRSVVVSEDLSVYMSSFPVESVSPHKVFLSVKPYFKKASISEIDPSALIVEACSIHDICIVSFSDHTDKPINIFSIQQMFPLATSLRLLCALLGDLT